MVKNKNTVEERVKAVLKDIDLFSGYGAVYHAIDGRSMPVTGQALCRLCQACVGHSSAASLCRHEATAAAYQAFVSGEPYYGRCWLGVFCLIMPVAPRGGNVTGAIEIGGILPPGELQKSQHSIMATLNAVAQDDSLSFFINTFQGLEEMPDIDIDNLKSFFVETIFSNGLLDASVFDANSAAWQQQQRLSAAVKRKRKLSPEKRRRSILMLADSLIFPVLDGDESAVSKHVDEILSIALGGEGSGWDSLDIKSVKAYLLPVLSVLAMNSLLLKEKWNSVMALHSRWIDDMAGIDDIKELCFWFESLIFSLISKKESVDSLEKELFSDKLIAYFYKHYSKHISMSAAAKHLGASPSSIMHKVKRETGKTFSQLLNGVRIKEAKRLLTFTTLPLNEISFRCGFRDQSYFTKVFVKYINLTPREFRNMLKMEMRDDG